MFLQRLTSARRSLYDGQFLGEGQLQRFHLRVIKPQLLHRGPLGLSQTVKRQETLLHLPPRVRNAVKVVYVISLQICRGLHIFVALHNVPEEVVEQIVP